MKVSEEYTPEGFPLLAAVARGSADYAPHAARVVRLEYASEDAPSKAYYFAGKGVCFDTGGLDIKVRSPFGLPPCVVPRFRRSSCVIAILREKYL